MNIFKEWWSEQNLRIKASIKIASREASAKTASREAWQEQLNIIKDLQGKVLLANFEDWWLSCDLKSKSPLEAAEDTWHFLENLKTESQPQSALYESQKSKEIRNLTELLTDIKSFYRFTKLEKQIINLIRDIIQRDNRIPHSAEIAKILKIDFNKCVVSIRKIGKKKLPIHEYKSIINGPFTYNEAVNKWQKEFILSQLREHYYDLKLTATKLKIPLSTLYRYISKYKIKR